MSITAIDIFAGIGGWNLAASTLGIRVVSAYNHDDRSLQTHALNFKQTKQHKLDIMTGNTEDIPDVDILLASPECTFQSNVSGVELLHQNQLRLPGFWTDRSDTDFIHLSRETMNGVYRWAEVKVKQGHPF